MSLYHRGQWNRDKLPHRDNVSKLSISPVAGGGGGGGSEVATVTIVLTEKLATDAYNPV